MKRNRIRIIGLISAHVFLSACNGIGDVHTSSYSSDHTSIPVNGIEMPQPGSGSHAPAKRSYETDVLLFTGNGTWYADISALRSIFEEHNVTYHEVDSYQLDSMTVDEISKFGLLLFPGGQGGTQASSLDVSTRAKIREAVQKRGVSYFGICAGAFIAVAPAPKDGNDVEYGLGVVDGPILDYYYLENQGTEIAMTLYKFPDGSTADILWYGGPITPNLPGGVIAKYPDGNPAISQMWSGKGFVVLSGGHPTATQDTLASLGLRSSDGTHLDLTWKLISAALHQQPLPSF